MKNNLIESVQVPFTNKYSGGFQSSGSGANNTTMMFGVSHKNMKMFLAGKVGKSILNLVTRYG